MKPRKVIRQASRTRSPRDLESTWPDMVLCLVVTSLVGGMFFCGQPATAQDSSQLSLEEIVVKVVNGTTRESGSAEKLSIYLAGAMAQPVAESYEVVGEVDFGRLPLRSGLNYIIIAVSEGVPYYAQALGQELEAEPAVVHTFSSTTDLNTARISGMNLIIRQGENYLHVEYLVTLLNEISPQQTVLPAPVTLEFPLPAGSEIQDVESIRGPSPVLGDSGPGSQDGWVGLVVPLVPGTNQLRVVATIPFSGQLDLPVGANVPIQDWSVLTFPEDMDIRAAGLETVEKNVESGYQRNRGPSLEAQQIYMLSLGAGSGPVITSVRSTAKPPDADLPVTGARKGSSSGALKYVVAIVLAGIVLFIVLRRRRS